MGFSRSPCCQKAAKPADTFSLVAHYHIYRFLQPIKAVPFVPHRRGGLGVGGWVGGVCVNSLDSLREGLLYVYADDREIQLVINYKCGCIV